MGPPKTKINKSSLKVKVGYSKNKIIKSSVKVRAKNKRSKKNRNEKSTKEIERLVKRKQVGHSGNKKIGKKKHGNSNEKVLFIELKESREVPRENSTDKGRKCSKNKRYEQTWYLSTSTGKDILSSSEEYVVMNMPSLQPVPTEK